MQHQGDQRSIETENRLIGTAGQVVQAGEISGGVHVHQSGRPPVPTPRQLPRNAEFLASNT